MEGENSFLSSPEKKLYKAKIVCSSCGKLMGEKDGFEQEGLISHSICEECLIKAKAELGAYLKEHPSKQE